MIPGKFQSKSQQSLAKRLGHSVGADPAILRLLTREQRQEFIRISRETGSKKEALYRVLDIKGSLGAEAWGEVYQRRGYVLIFSTRMEQEFYLKKHAKVVVPGNKREDGTYVFPEITEDDLKYLRDLSDEEIVKVFNAKAAFGGEIVDD